MKHHPPTSWSELVVAQPAPPEGRVAPVSPPQAARVNTRLHNGLKATLDVEIVARAPGLVRVAQNRGTGRPWLAWIPEGDVQHRAGPDLDHGTAPDAADLPQPWPPAE